MGLSDDLERVAAAAGRYGVVSAVLAAEPASGRRAYLVALGEDETREWLVLDAGLAPIDTRDRVREVASIVVLCELAGEVAGGGDLEDLRAQLAQLRMTEQPEGIEQAEQAALELERAVAAPPWVASPVYLDAVGGATRRLEQALGGHESPFANAIASSSGTVEAFIAEVESRYRISLR
jgi:hypothetical protein